MKKAVLVIVVVVAAVVAWKVGLFQSAAVKAYKAHRQQVLEARGFSKDLVGQRKWSLKVDSCEVTGSQAVVTATEKTATIPPNAASFVFATIVTRQLRAELERGDGGWSVVKEEVTSEETSTYEDRKSRVR